MHAEAQSPAAVVRPLYFLAACNHDCPDSQEADAGDHLGTHSRRIDTAGERRRDVLIGQHGKGSTHADENMGSEACGMFCRSALQADDAAEQHGKEEAEGHRNEIDVIKVIRQ